MEAIYLTHYTPKPGLDAFLAFEDALHQSQCCYSLQKCVRMGLGSPEDLLEALEKAVRVCALAGISARHHFRKVYLSDPQSGVSLVDWLMSKRGFHLVIMQASLVNEQAAKWLWERADW